MEDTKILVAYKVLANHVDDFLTAGSVPMVTMQAVQNKLSTIKAASSDAGTSFNASEQIQSLQHAQKELELLVDDFMTTNEAGQLTDTQYKVLMSNVHDCDTIIRSMSDPEYS